MQKGLSKEAKLRISKLAEEKKRKELDDRNKKLLDFFNTLSREERRDIVFKRVKGTQKDLKQLTKKRSSETYKSVFPGLNKGK